MYGPPLTARSANEVHRRDEFEGSVGMPVGLRDMRGDSGQRYAAGGNTEAPDRFDALIAPTEPSDDRGNRVPLQLFI